MAGAGSGFVRKRLFALLAACVVAVSVGCAYSSAAAAADDGNPDERFESTLTTECASPVASSTTSVRIRAADRGGLGLSAC